jgi:hypothetical protein
VFKEAPALLKDPYEIKSYVPPNLFWEFVAALKDRAVEITPANLHGLSILSDEFGFDSLRARLSL